MMARIHWLETATSVGTACGSGGLVTERTPDLTCRECIRLAAAHDRIVRIGREARAAADPWQAVRGREF